MELTGVWQELGLDDINEKLLQLFPASQISLYSLMEKLFCGDIFGALQELMEARIFDMGFERDSVRQVMVQLLVLGVSSAALLLFSDMFEKYRASELSFYFVFLMQMGILTRCYYAMADIAGSTLKTIVDFVKLLMPAYFMTISVATGSLTAGAGYQMVLFLIYGVEEILKGFFLPTVTVFFLLVAMEGLQTQEKAIVPAEVIEKAINWGLKGIIGLVAGWNLLQTMLLPGIDRMKGTALQRIAAAIPGIGDAAESVYQIGVGSAQVIKSSVGVILLIVLLILCLQPLAKILFFGIALKICGAALGMVADKRLTSFIDKSGNAIFLLFRVTGTAMLLFMIVIAVAASVKL